MEKHQKEQAQKNAPPPAEEKDAEMTDADAQKPDSVEEAS
jgi:hypothetical protein